MLPPTLTDRSSLFRKMYKRVCYITPGLWLLLFLLIFKLATYNGTSQAYQQAEQAREQLDQQLRQAQRMGVPASYWRPLVLQEQQIENGIWFQLLFHPFTADVYQQQVHQYHALSTRLPGIIQSATKQLRAQAQQDLQQFQVLLARVTAQGVAGLASFDQSLSQAHDAFPAARLPRDYLAVSSTANAAITELHLLASISQQLSHFSSTIDEMKQISFDTTSLQAMYQRDLQQFNNATQLPDLQQLSAQVDTHYQQLQIRELQLFPSLSVMKLRALASEVRLLALYGAQDPSYQAHLDAFRIAQQQIHTLADKRAFLNTIDTYIASLRDPLIQREARYLLKQFQHEVEVWAKAHLYHDSYDGRNYAPNNGYMDAGIGNILDKELTTARTNVDFTTMVENVQNALFDLHQFEQDFQDKTLYNRVHASDTQILNHYGFQHRQVVLVSLAEQAMRVYQDGKLVQAFLVTTGRQELPSIPGAWPVLMRRTPIIFQAGEPKHSPYWFPDTFIRYAMLYHLGGYFVHDAPWRKAFGPGTQFPHYDPIGTNAYNFDGSHGCINLSENDAAWVYTHTNWNTVIVIY